MIVHVTMKSNQVTFYRKYQNSKENALSNYHNQQLIKTRHRRCLCLGGMLCIHACLTKYAELKYTSSNESLLLLVEHYFSG